MSRFTTIHCSRCGATILGGHSIIELKAGSLATRHDEPIDLCGECAEAFDDWMRGPREDTSVRLAGQRAGAYVAIDDVPILCMTGGSSTIPLSAH